jgi:hypothetical protein
MLRPDLDLIRVVHAERLERDLAAVARSRMRATGTARPRRRIRRPIGRLLVRVGAWLAAEGVSLPGSTRRAGIMSSTRT